MLFKEVNLTLTVYVCKFFFAIPGDKILFLRFCNAERAHEGINLVLTHDFEVFVPISHGGSRAVLRDAQCTVIVFLGC